MTQSSFTVPSWKDAQPSQAHARASTPASAGWDKLAERLDAAKRQAAQSFARLSATQTLLQDQAGYNKSHDAWSKDEVAVLRARVALLNAMMLANDDAHPPCIEHANSGTPRVCVMYNRMRCADGHELGPMQSTLAWTVRGAENPLQHIMTAGEAHQPDALRELLDLIRSFMPVRTKSDALQPLHDLLSLRGPSSMLLRPTGANSPALARVMEGLGEEQPKGRGLAPMYSLLWTALDVSAQEGWQNPSTNAAIRLSILDTAQQAIQQAAREKISLWSNATFLQIHVAHDDEKHVLSILPFSDSESCTVTHMLYKQSMFDQNGPERGILNLSPDPASIHAIPLGTVLQPMRSYVCPGAHRRSRLSEAQLNYAHAQGLLAHGFDTALLPKAESLRFEPGGRIPAAKSTRLSAAGLDVMASSYHIADQVYTTISIVQYPPFGTQFAIREQASRLQTAQSIILTAPEEWGDQGDGDDGQKDKGEGQDEDDSEGEDKASDNTPEPDDDGSDLSSENEYETVEELFPWTKWNTGDRMMMNENNENLFTVGREKFYPKLRADGKYEHKPHRWFEPLKTGQYYFVDAVEELSSNYREMENTCHINRWVLFEIDNGTAYKTAQEAALAIRSELISKKFRDWKPDLSFYENLYEVPAAHKIWKDSWRGLIATMHAQYGMSREPDEGARCFWYNPSKMAFMDVENYVRSQNLDIEYNATHAFLQARKLKHYWQDKGMINEYNGGEIAYKLKKHGFMNKRMRIPAQVFSSRKPGATKPLAAGQIRRPQSKPVTKAQGHDLDDLTARVNSLQRQVRDAKQDENTQHLLMLVLDKLDA